ncbi:MAG: (d)CMP kinase [Nanoarchaeota archaeon]
MIISIDGTPGSGKSSIGKKIAQKYKLKFYSMGDLMRNIAKRKGITLEELNRLRDRNGDIDRDVDDYQRELGKEEDDFVITGRTSFHFIPHGIKIFLKTDYEEAARRIFPDLQKSNERNENTYRSKDALSHAIRERNEGDKRRYMKYYKLDVNDAFHYDLVLETKKLSEKKVFELVDAFVYAMKRAK